LDADAVGGEAEDAATIGIAGDAETVDGIALDARLAPEAYARRRGKWRR
jgi:Na+-transporting methylmalonyl-CoA/oxaloacetate decarboxylase beta subunit